MKKLHYFDLYISYNSAQLIQVEHVCQMFKQANMRIWYDQDGLIEETENKFDESIQALQSSFIFLCFPSKEYKKCLKNRIEYSIALEQEMKIICVNLEDIKMPNTVEINLNETQLNSKESIKIIINYLKLEIENISKTFKQSFKKPVQVWYESLGIRNK
jgi:hypothetical protein